MVDHQPRRALGSLDGEGDVVEAPDRVLGRNGAAGPSCAPVFGSRELYAQAVGVFEGEDSVPEAVARFLEADAVLKEALRPVAQRGSGDGERGHDELASPDTSPRRVRPREEGHDRTRATRAVAVVEMVGLGIVEVDGLLDQAQAKDAGVEVHVTLRLARDGGYVVDSGGPRRHGSPLRDFIRRRIILAPADAAPARQGPRLYLPACAVFPEG